MKTSSVVGVGIGCAAIGALLAVLIYFLMARRRKTSRSSKADIVESSSSRRSRGSVSGIASKEANLDHRSPAPYDGQKPVGGRAGNLDDILPQPLADEKVKQEVNGLFAMIDGHAINFYHEYPVSGSARKIKANALPAARSAQSEADLERLLSEPRTRSGVIASIICAKLLDSISTVGEIDKSLLPPVVTIFLQSIPAQPDSSHGKLPHVMKSNQLMISSLPTLAVTVESEYNVPTE